MQPVVTKWNRIMGLFPLGEAQELGENLIFYFLSVLNTIQLLVLRQKLRAMRPDNAKVSWIIDYLADRPQFVLSRSSVLDLLLQRSTVLSAFLIRTLSLTRLNCGHATPTFSLMIPSLWAAWGGALHMSLVGRWAGWSKETICSWLFSKWRRLLEPGLDKWDIFSLCHNGVQVGGVIKWRAENKMLHIKAKYYHPVAVIQELSGQVEVLSPGHLPSLSCTLRLTASARADNNAFTYSCISPLCLYACMSRAQGQASCVLTTHVLPPSLRGFACWVKLYSVKKQKAHLTHFHHLLLLALPRQLEGECVCVFVWGGRCHWQWHTTS